MAVLVNSANSPYDVSAGQADTGDIVDSGGSMYVLAGGLAQSTTVNVGGFEYVNTNGTDAGATLSGGEQNVYGLATGATADSGGQQVVESSGTAASTTLNASGYQLVYGIANNTTINSGGEQFVYAGGTANTTISSGGAQVVFAGGAAIGTTIKDGTELVYAGGQAQNITFAGAAALDLESPSGLIGTITDWQIGDIIDFLHTSVTSASISGSTLTVATNGGGTSSYQLSGPLSDTGPILQSDGSGGTVVELAPINLPVLSGGGNSVTYAPQGAAVAIDAGLGVSDLSSAMLAGASVAISAGFFAGDTLNFTNQNGIAGSYNAGTGVLTLTRSASLADYQAALESITFSSTSGNPSNSGADPSRAVSWTVTDGTLSSNSITSTIAIAAFAIDDLTTGVQSLSQGTPYTGPVAGLLDQYINTTSDNLNVAALAANTFIHTGSGEDAIDVSHVGGINVLDGGTNSNFLVGGTGPSSFDTFFVDDRGPSSDIWSTVANFHSGDAATIFGITQNGFNTAWVDGQGAAGYTGLTLHVTAPGVPTASLTLSGYTTADLTNGTLTASYGTENDGTPYLYVHANS